MTTRVSTTLLDNGFNVYHVCWHNIVTGYFCRLRQFVVSTRGNRNDSYQKNTKYWKNSHMVMVYKEVKPTISSTRL